MTSQLLPVSLQNIIWSCLDPEEGYVVGRWVLGEYDNDTGVHPRFLSKRDNRTAWMTESEFSESRRSITLPAVGVYAVRTKWLPMVKFLCSFTPLSDMLHKAIEVADEAIIHLLRARGAIPHDWELMFRCFAQIPSLEYAKYMRKWMLDSNLSGGSISAFQTLVLCVAARRGDIPMLTAAVEWDVDSAIREMPSILTAAAMGSQLAALAWFRSRDDHKEIMSQWKDWDYANILRSALVSGEEDVISEVHSWDLPVVYNHLVRDLAGYLNVNTLSQLILCAAGAEEEEFLSCIGEAVLGAVRRSNLPVLEMFRKYYPIVFENDDTLVATFLFEKGVDGNRNSTIIDCRVLMFHAILGGHTEVMKFLKPMCRPFAGAFRAAAYENMPGALRLLREWGAEWGGANPNRALVAVVRRNRGNIRETLHMLKSWGADNFDAALRVLDKRKNRIKKQQEHNLELIVGLLTQWKLESA